MSIITPEEFDALTRTDADIEAALKEAHLPALIMSLVHMTGDGRWLGDEFRPVYNPFGDGRTGGLPEAVQDKVRAAAKPAGPAPTTNTSQCA